MKILIFSAIWCGDCRLMKPTLRAIKAEYPKLLFVDLDYDENPKTVKEYKIKRIPTILIIDENAKEVDRIEGLQHISFVENLLTKYINV